MDSGWGADRARHLVGRSLIALGAVVLVGWTADLTALTRVNAAWTPMMVNTAGAFILLGVALDSDVPRRRVGFAIVTCAIGLLTTIEYVVGVDLGIDDPLGFVEAGTSARMSPNAALAFSIVGLALAWPDRSATHRHVSTAAASLVLALGVVPLIGYLTGLEDVRGWGSLTRMAAHTALGFTAAGITMLTGTLSADVRRRRNTWFSFGLVTVILALFVTVWSASAASGAAPSGAAPATITLLGAITAISVTTAITYARDAASSRIRLAAVGAALEQSLDGSARLDQHGVIIEADANFRALFPSVSGSTTHWTTLIPEAERPTVADAVAIAPTAGRAVAHCRLGEPGNADAMTLRIVVVVHPAGPAHGLYWAIQNVTERERAIEELLHSNEELERFASVVSHDLKEPLRMVSGYTQLLQRRYAGQLDETAHEFIEYTVNGARRMQQLIEDLLAYARASNAEEHRESVALDEVVDCAMELLEGQIEESGADITVGGLPTLEVDRAQLSQVFANLLSNAIKYRGEDAPRVEIEALRQPGCWRISVRDYGIGIPRHQRERVFQAFERLHSKAKIEGTGVGLAICQRIVERHGGRIWIEDPAVGPGSVFVFTIRDDRASDSGAGGGLLRAASSSRITGSAH